jgi:hypothetical protein
MLPRWFRALIAVQMVLAVIVVVLGVRLASGASRSAGQVINWFREQATTPAPLAAPPTLPASAATPSPAGGRAAIAPDLLARLDRDAARTAAGQYGLLLRVEALIRDRIVDIIEQQTGTR